MEYSHSIYCTFYVVDNAAIFNSLTGTCSQCTHTRTKNVWCFRVGWPILNGGVSCGPPIQTTLYTNLPKDTVLYGRSVSSIRDGGKLTRNISPGCSLNEREQTKSLFDFLSNNYCILPHCVSHIFFSRFFSSFAFRSFSTFWFALTNPFLSFSKFNVVSAIPVLSLAIGQLQCIFDSIEPFQIT